MKVEGYIGICGGCFEPIREGEGRQLIKGGSFYHHSCIENKPGSYYITIDLIEADYAAGTDSTILMDQMERIFKIPGLNDEQYNQDNEEVIKLYREIAASRNL